MKNFTNNFKQFTSRLSARWLIMALMLLVGTGSAWGWSISANRNVYLYDATTTCNVKLQVWANNSWDNTHDMTKLGNGVYQYKVGNEGYNNYSGFQFIKDCSTKSYVGPFYQDINSVNSCRYNNSWSFPPVWSLTIANNGTNVSKGGSGTQADPYLVPENSTVKVKVSSVGYEENGLGIQYSWKSTGAATSYAANDTDDSFTIGAAGTVVGVVCDAKTEYGGNLCSVGCASNTIYFKSYTTCNPAKLSWGNINTSMTKGSTQTISATLTTGAGSVTYTSSDENVITVNGALLTAVGNGTAIITATHTSVTSGYCTAEEINQSVTVSTKIPSGTKLYFDFSNATTWGSGHFLSIVASANTSYTANDSNTSGVGSGLYSPKKDNKPWVSLTEECTNIYSYTTTTDITTGISLWANDINGYNDVYNTDVVLNLKHQILTHKNFVLQ